MNNKNINFNTTKMRRKLLIVLFSFTLTLSSLAQQNYYDGLDLFLTGLDLKNILSDKIIDTHTNLLDYTPDTWNASMSTDFNPINSSEILLIYGYENGTDGDITNDREREIDNNGGGVGQWNREHTFPRSLANPDLDQGGTNQTANSDAHNLRPSDVQRNGLRGNKLFTDGSGNSSTVGSYWYPGDEWRGDVARIIMYMYLRYGSQCLPTYVGIGDSSNTPDDMIDLFLEWNAEDPVSDVEIQRNDFHENTSNYEAQGNRNPFIDNPRLATRIWGGPIAEDRWNIYEVNDNEAPSIPSNISISNETGTSFVVNWTASTDNISVTEYDIYLDNSYYDSTTVTSFTVTELENSTTYSVSILAKDAANNSSELSSPTEASTTDGNSNTTIEILISEYVEGSSNNKAIEIANIKTSPVNLNGYNLRRDSNGNGVWSEKFDLTGTIDVGDVVVIINANANAQLLIDQADIVVANNQSTNYGEPLNFNGNDPVGLFKDDILIDIVGVFGGGSSNFAKDVTLRRKAEVIEPNINFDLDIEWEVFPKDTFDDLGGTHLTLSTENYIWDKLSIYPNPTTSDYLYINYPETIKTEIFNVLGKKLTENIVRNGYHKIDISKLKKGFYLIKISDNLNSTVRKFIKN